MAKQIEYVEVKMLRGTLGEDGEHMAVDGVYTVTKPFAVFLVHAKKARYLTEADAKAAAPKGPVDAKAVKP